MCAFAVLMLETPIPTEYLGQSAAAALSMMEYDAHQLTTPNGY